MAQTHSLDLEASSSQYASISDASQTGLDVTGSITLMAWIKQETAGNNYVIVKDRYGSGASRGYLLNTQGTDKVNLQLFPNAAGTGGVDLVGATSVGTGQWMHIAGTYDGTTAKIYLNGRLDGSTAYSSGINNSTAPLFIGVTSNGGTPSLFLDGLVKDARVYNTALTQAEIVAEARTENSVHANLQGEWNFNNAYTDSSGNGNTLTASGSPVFSTDIPDDGTQPKELFLTEFASDADLFAYWKFDPSIVNDMVSGIGLGSGSGSTSISGGKFGYGRDFDGADGNSYVNTPNGSPFTAGNMKTICFWLKLNTLPGITDFILDNSNTSSGATNFIRMSVDSSGVVSYQVTGGSAGYSATPSSALSTGTWYHVAATHNGNGSNVILYINGVATGAGATIGEAIGDNSEELYIGRLNPAHGTTGREPDMTIDDLAIFDRALTADEIDEIANGISVSAFTPRVSMFM